MAPDFTIPTNPHLVPPEAQRLMRELLACHACADDWYSPTDHKGGARAIDVLGALGLAERYGGGWRLTQTGHATVAHIKTKWIPDNATR